MKNILFSILFVFQCVNLFAQRDYSFNGSGNVCYFNYIEYAPNDNYNAANRPYIYILGNDGETAKDAFANDTLKNLAQFYNYLFIYIPNRGVNSNNKLECVGALVSLTTTNFTSGKSNLFFQVYDKSITQTDINVNSLNTSFKSVRLSNVRSNNSDENTVPNNVAEDFKEDVTAYETEKKTEDDKYGTFYEEETKADNAPAFTKAQKTYFGPPQSFKFTLSGVIRDQSTGEALPFSTVMVRGTTNGVTTNADGYFTLQKIPSDTSVLVAQYVGYEKTEVFLTPQTPKKNLSIEIQPSSSNLKTVTVVGYKEDVVLVSKSDVSVIKMTPKKLEQLPNMGERDIMRSFQLMPGVSASNESSSGLYVRGGTPDQNLVLYDGFTVYQVDHLYGFFSAFNSNALKDVQLYKGGFESRFGGRLSSVTEITGKDGNQNKINVGGDLSLLSLNVFAEVPIGKKFSSVVTFRRSYKGPIYNKIFEKFNKSTSSSSSASSGSGPGGRQSQATTVSSYFYDLNGKFTYRPTDKDIISLSVFNGTDKLDNSTSFSAPSFGGASTSAFSASTTDLTKYGNFGSSLKWSRKWNDKLYGNTILSYSNYYSNRDRSVERTATNASGETTTNKNGVFEKNNLKDYSIKSDYQWDMFSFSQLQFGGFGTYYDIKYTYAQNDTSTILDKKNKAILAGGYIQSKTKLFKDKVQFLPGIRASYFETTKKMYYEPRASLSINITSRLTLKGATGKYYQFANRVTREDILTGSKDFWLLSDGKSVPVSSSIHYIAGLSYETNSYLFSAEAYYKQIKDLTEYSLRFNPSPVGVTYNENFYTGNNYARGIEFLVQKKSGNFNGWVSYTLGETKSRFEIYSDTYFPANQDVTHEFKIVGLYKFKRWDFSATWVFATGRPYTAPSGAYSVALLDGSTQDFFTVTAKNGLRLPNYHRCDISANYKLLKGAKGDKKRREIGYIGFSIFNLYNRTNTWYKEYTIQDNKIIETNVNYLGITPNLTLSLKLR
ncbi:MAG: TonB-dependent receptor [Bacteroidia bacterium]